MNRDAREDALLPTYITRRSDQAGKVEYYINLRTD